MNRTTITDACGHVRGYLRHRRNREAPCGACLRANSEASGASRILNGRQDTVRVDVVTLGRLLHNADLRTLQAVQPELGGKIMHACRERFLAR